MSDLSTARWFQCKVCHLVYPQRRGRTQDKGRHGLSHNAGLFSSPPSLKQPDIKISHLEMDLIYAAWPRTKEFSSVACNCNGVKGTSELEQQWCISCGVIQPTPAVPLCRGFWLPLVSPRAHCRLEWWRPSRRGRAHPALPWLLTPGVSGRFNGEGTDR